MRVVFAPVMTISGNRRKLRIRDYWTAFAHRFSASRIHGWYPGYTGPVRYTKNICWGGTPGARAGESFILHELIIGKLFFRLIMPEGREAWLDDSRDADPVTAH
jgi:hypothetical protein